jgi:hypothetical protein
MPPSAGPTARETLKPTLLAAVALSRILPRHEQRHDRRPGRRGQSARDAKESGRRQESGGVRQAERDETGEHHANDDDARLDHDEQAARVDDVGKCASRQGEEEER